MLVLCLNSLKMILKRLIKILAIFAVSCSWAQEINVDIQKTKLFESENKFFGLHDIKDDGNGGFIALREFSKATFTDKRFYQVEFYDKKMKLTKSFELDFKKEFRVKHENFLLSLLVKEGVYHLIVFEHNAKSKEYVCSVLSSKLNELSLVKKELFRIEETKIKSGFLGQYDPENILQQHVFFNENKTNFAVMIDIYEDKNDSKNFYIFDNNFNLIKDYNSVKNVKDENCRLIEIVLSNTNEVYLLNEIWREKNKDRKELGEVYYELDKISNDNKASSIKVSGNGKERFDVPKIKLNDNSLFLVSYYYDDKETRKGLAVFEYNANDLVLKTNKFNLFTDKLILEKQNAKGKVEWHPIRVNDIYFDTNELIVCSEEYYEVSGGVGSNSYSYWRRGDVFIEKINFKNEVYWENLTHRNRPDKNVGLMPTKSFYKDGDLYLFSNVLDENKLDEINVSLSKLNRSLSCFKISKDGKFNYSDLINGEEITSYINLSGVFCENKNEFLFIGTVKDKNVYQYYKITF
jgi:hypothetical protein